MADKKPVPAASKVTELARARKAPVLSRTLEAEDEVRRYYADDSLGAGMALIEPPYNPVILQRVVSENNTLEPCIDAMITNIDLTGYRFVTADRKQDRGSLCRTNQQDRVAVHCDAQRSWRYSVHG